MKLKDLLLTAALMSAAQVCVAAGRTADETGDDGDSLKLAELQEVVVRGVWAPKNAPFAVANVKAPDLQAFSKTGQELPFLFAQTPGVLAWSENGLGTGTTYMRIRGAAGSRVNVTLDGVPLNSPEDQTVFWANMNSYGSLLGGVQIQRGVGTSTNGDGAFGGTVALQTKAPATTAGGEVNFSYGSYNTMNVGGNFSTGLLWEHLIFDGAYHETRTDGFVHGTSGRSGSYYGGLTWLGDNFTLRYKNIGNFEKTGQAWNGVTAGNDDSSLMDGMYLGETGIKTYKDLYDRGLGRYNSLYESLIYDAGFYQFLQDANGNYMTQRYEMSDGSLWSKTTDNFWQNHNLLTGTWTIGDRWSTTASLHYTHGYGYYKEFRPDNKLKKFGLSNYTDAEGNTVSRSDFVRKKGLSQNAYGLVWNLGYKDEDWDVTGGLSLQQFDGNHFGHLTYVGNAALRSYLLKDGDYQYYDSDANKFDGNVYLKALYHLSEQFDAFADMQYRHVGYKTDGYNDKFIDNNDGTYGKHFLDIDEKYDFLNPKAGFSFHSGPHRAFASLALSHREPERNNFTDNGHYPAPEAESLLDYELGYSFAQRDVNLGITLYYMDYDNQFVQTGAQSDIGENLTSNVKDSYRMGVELTAGWNVTPWLTLEGNAALSANKIKDFDEVVEDWRDKYAKDPEANAEAMAKWHIDGDGDGYRTLHHDNSTLAFSPSAILNGFVNVHFGGWQAVWHTGYVSRQYLDNSACKDRSLPAYSTSSLNVSYTLPCKRWLGLRETVFNVRLNNLFDARYASSGWVYSAIDEKDGFTPDHRYYQIGFIPMAGFTMMGGVTLRF